MLEAIKINSNEIKIINFPTNNEGLENYLKKFIISREYFNYNKDYLNISELLLLEKYYIDSYNRACTLVLEEEFVGKTFDNLDEISKVIRQNKHVK